MTRGKIENGCEERLFKPIECAKISTTKIRIQKPVPLRHKRQEHQKPKREDEDVGHGKSCISAGMRDWRLFDAGHCILS